MLEQLFGKRKTVERAADVKPISPKSAKSALESVNDLPLDARRIRKADGSELPISFASVPVQEKINIRENFIPALKSGAGEKEVQSIDAEIQKHRQIIESLEAERKDIVSLVNAIKPGTYPM